MDNRILDIDVQDFIKSNIKSDLEKLALSKNPFPEIDFPLLLSQISAASKAREKLPTWFNASGIYYPSRLSMEQTSSEITASYKSRIVSGENAADLAGGFGVDTYFFSKKFDYIWHCESQQELSEIAAHNFKVLGAGNIKCFAGDGMEFLQQSSRYFDLLYIDPSRRNDAKGKVFLLSDCLPDVPSNLDKYFEYSDKILIKTSPILDISAALRELSNVSEIHVVSVKNEVKELLFLMEKGYDGGIKVLAVNLLQTDEETLEFILGSESNEMYSHPMQYLYEPNAAIMKAGGFSYLCERFAVTKLHPHSHLFTSDEVLAFPGRRFKIDDVYDYGKSAAKELSQLKQANITTRNFPETPEQIKKRLKLKDGGAKYLFFTTGPDDKKIVLLCSKI